MPSSNNQTDRINDRDPPTYDEDRDPGSPPPPGGQLASGSYRPGGPTRPSNGDWQEAGLRPDANSPGPFRPQPEDQLASGSYRPGGPTRPSNGDWQEAGLRPDANSPGPFRPQPEDQLASGSYRPGGPTRPSNGDWQEAGMRPDANSPGPFNPTQGQTLASKQYDEQDPTFIREGGPRMPLEVQKLAESMKQSGKYEAYDREQVGNIAAAAFNSAGGKFTPTDVVQVANGQFVAVGGDPQNPASPRTDPIDPKVAAATPALQSLAQLNQPQQAQMVAQTNDIENPAHKPRSV